MTSQEQEDEKKLLQHGGITHNGQVRRKWQAGKCSGKSCRPASSPPLAPESAGPVPTPCDQRCRSHEGPLRAKANRMQQAVQVL